MSIKKTMWSWGGGMRSALSVAGLILAVCATAQDPGMEISGFRVPEYNDQGEMTSQIFGEHAEIREDGMVKITTLRIEFYQNGKTAMTVRSPLCYYDQKKRTARSDEPVEADAERVKIRGRGFFLDADNSTVRVLNDSHVAVEDLMGQSGNAAQAEGAFETNNVTVITSKELFFEYNARTVRFEQDVHVEDPGMALDSETLELRFNENNEIDWIEALTDVKLINEGKEAWAGKATYDITTDEFVLEDNPRLNDGTHTLYGTIIRFRRGSKKMLCAPGARLVIYPDDDMKTNIFEK